MPPGLANKKDRNPLNFTREEWQQAKRAGANPKEIKRVFQDSWAISDSKKAFAQALLQQGFVLARGDRRGFVAIDYQGEAYAIAKYTGVRTKAVKERLGDPKELPSVEEAKVQIAANMTDKLKTYLEKAERDKQRRSASFEFKRKELVERQRSERSTLEQKHQERLEQETNSRAKRLSSGLKTGKSSNLRDEYRKWSELYEKERKPAPKRDKSQNCGHEPEI